MRFKETTNYFCFRCNTKLEKETELDYPYFCPKCDENMFSFEALKITVKRKIRRYKA